MLPIGFDPETGGATLLGLGPFRCGLRAGGAELWLDGGCGWQASRRADGLLAVGACRGVRAELGLHAAGDEAVVVELALRFDADTALEQVIVAAGPLPFTDAARFYRNGWSSWASAEVHALGEARHPFARPDRLPMVEDPRHPPTGLPGEQRSALLAAFREREAQLLVGFLGAGGGSPRVHTHRRGAAHDLEAFVDLSGGPPTRELRCPPLYLSAAAGAQAFARYAARVAQGAALPARPPPPRLWCSWYSHHADVTEGDVLRAARAARELALPLDVIQLDDGWQTAVGDWLSVDGAKFPAGLGALAREIRAAGFAPGIWLAPLCAAQGSRLLAEHRDWLVRDPADGSPRVAGRNWGGPYHALDLAHPDAEAHLRRVIRALARELGFPFLKLDFLAAAALPGLRRARWTPAEALRRALEIVREEAGPASYLLGCGCPLGEAIGLVDGMRLGPDVAPFLDDSARRRREHDATFPSLRNALVSSLNRWFMGAWFDADPDVVYLRAGTSTRTASMAAARIMGGIVGTSEPLHELGPSERGALRTLLDRHEPLLPVDPFTVPCPVSFTGPQTSVAISRALG